MQILLRWQKFFAAVDQHVRAAHAVHARNMQLAGGSPTRQIGKAAVFLNRLARFEQRLNWANRYLDREAQCGTFSADEVAHITRGFNAARQALRELKAAAAQISAGEPATVIGRLVPHATPTMKGSAGLVHLWRLVIDPKKPTKDQ